MIGNLFAPLGMKIAGGIAVALALACAFLWWRADGLSEQRDKARAALVLAEGEIALLKADAALKEIASAERQSDTAAVAEAEKDLLDAIADIPDTVPDSVRVQLNCRRLRAQGRLDADLPSVCRFGGGSQAGSD